MIRYLYLGGYGNESSNYHFATVQTWQQCPTGQPLNQLGLSSIGLIGLQMLYSNIVHSCQVIEHAGGEITYLSIVDQIAWPFNTFMHLLWLLILLCNLPRETIEAYRPLHRFQCRFCNHEARIRNFNMIFLCIMQFIIEIILLLLTSEWRAQHNGKSLQTDTHGMLA